MLLISHRGNIDGPNIEKENHPDYILNAFKRGFKVEIDVWFVNGKWCLGHDRPIYENVRYDFLLNSSYWLHAKNGDAFYKLVNDPDINAFYHTTEKWVLTTQKFIWTYPGETLYPKSICVLPELGYNGDLSNCVGICSDYIEKYKNYNKHPRSII
jgi:hypothetical protein